MDDWKSRIFLGLIPVALAISGWVLSLESRIQVIDARQQERTGRFDNLEHMLGEMEKQISDPSPKPETKIAIEGLRRDMDNTHEEIVRLNERLNNLHNFLLQTPPFKPNTRRGSRFDTPLIYPQTDGLGLP